MGILIFCILSKLNNKTHYLHTAACICKGGSMISHFHESCKLVMKNLSDKELNDYLNKKKKESESLDKITSSKIKDLEKQIEKLGEKPIFFVPKTKYQKYYKNKLVKKKNVDCATKSCQTFCLCVC